MFRGLRSSSASSSRSEPTIVEAYNTEHSGFSVGKIIEPFEKIFTVKKGFFFFPVGICGNCQFENVLLYCQFEKGLRYCMFLLVQIYAEAKIVLDENVVPAVSAEI